MRGSSALSIILGIMLLAAACSKQMSGDDLKKAGQRAFLEKNYKEARDYLMRALHEKPSDKELLYYVGLAYRRDQMYDSALFYLKRAQLLYPTDRELNQELLEVATGLKNWQVSLDAIQGLIGSGEPASKFYAQQADLWGKMDYPVNGLYFSRKALAQDTTNLALWMATANFAAQMDSIDLALSLTDTAIARFGENDRLTANRATFLSLKGKNVEAEKILRNLEKKDSTNTFYRLNLANVLAVQNDKAKKREARDLYLSVKGKIGSDLKLDSLIAKIDSSLK